jgi:hypothetical protein
MIRPAKSPACAVVTEWNESRNYVDGADVIRAKPIATSVLVVLHAPAG